MTVADSYRFLLTVQRAPDSSGTASEHGFACQTYASMLGPLQPPQEDMF